jgi:7-cyano-7-deazaguanine synthase
MRRIRKAIVLLSGGVDSTTLLAYVKEKLGASDIRALSFRYGQKHSRELKMAAWQARRYGVREHRIIDISFLGQVTGSVSALTGKKIKVPTLSSIDPSQKNQPATYVPNRNMIFLSMVAAYAESFGIFDVYYGAHAQDIYGYWDCTPGFVKSINKLLGLNRRKPVIVHAPFLEMAKADIVRLGLKLGVDYDMTWSCYKGGKAPCGVCPTCVDRRGAMEAVDGGR